MTRTIRDKTLQVSSLVHACWPREIKRLQPRNQGRKLHWRVCFIDPSFVNWSIDSSQASHVAAPEIETAFAKQKFFIISQILHSLTKPQNKKAVLWHLCTSDSLITFIIYCADDPEHWYSNEVCWRALLSQMMFPIFYGNCPTTI